jgi:methylated-DNA-[protein]-cysteine S-methyltransferase
VEKLAYGLVDAPWGPVHVATTTRAVVAVSHLVPTDGFLDGLRRRWGGEIRPAGPGADPAATRLAQAAMEALATYLAGERRAFELPIDLGHRPAWDVAVLDGVRQVPWGHVTSYGRVARRIGRPGAARAVGGAVGRNPVGILVPCHRVVAGDGTIGGYGGDWWGSRDALLEIKRELLRLEGVTIPARELFD